MHIMYEWGAVCVRETSLAHAITEAVKFQDLWDCSTSLRYEQPNDVVLVRRPTNLRHRKS